MFDLQNVSRNTQAALLLTSQLRQSARSESSLLSHSEYNSLVATLRKTKLQLADLFDSRNLSLLSGVETPDLDRIKSLMSRGFALAIAIEKWHAQGIWVIGRDDAEYPVCYKTKLKDQSPPILYGIGDAKLLHNGGLAIVGSRNADEKGLTFARNVAKLCADNGIQVVSGAARGVDREAMLSCIEHGGQAVGVLSDSLGRQAISTPFRDAVIAGNLTFISPFEPESRFSVGNAMARNKLIYALAEFALVVSSDSGKGGTWAGAIDNLKKSWTPIFVRIENDAPDGNIELVKRGAIPLDLSSVPLSELVNWMREQIAKQANNSPASSDSTQATLPLFD